MNKDINMLNDEVIMGNNFTKQSTNGKMMNLHNKTFMELNSNELQREIDYLWGQYDFVSQSEELPHDFKIKKVKFLEDEIDALTTRYLLKSMDSIRCSMDYIADEMKGMRKQWGN